MYITQFLFPYSSLNNGNCLHTFECHSDGLVCAELHLPPYDAHLSQEEDCVVPSGVSIQGLLRLPVLNQVEGVRVNLPQELIVDKPRTFLNTTKWSICSM